MNSPQPNSRRFRIGLRAFFLLIVLLSVVLGWVGAQLQWIHQRTLALRWIHPLHARQLAVSEGRTLPPRKGSYATGGRAPWSLALFGETGIELLELDPRWLERDDHYSVERFKALFPEAELRLATSRPPLVKPETLIPRQ